MTIEDIEILIERRMIADDLDVIKQIEMELRNAGIGFEDNDHGTHWWRMDVED